MSKPQTGTSGALASEPSGICSAAQFYDQVSPVYDLSFAHSAKETRRQVKWLARFCAPGRLLDLGCGSGRMLSPLAKAGFSPIGLDCSPRMLSLARAAAPGVPLLLADAGLALPFGAASFSTVISLHATVSHLHREEQRRTMASEVLRVLRPGGTLVVELPHPSYYPKPACPGSWRHFQKGVSCRREGERLELMRLDDLGGLATYIHVFDLPYLRCWLRDFAQVQLHPGFAGGAFNPRKGDSMVVCARKPR